MSPEFTMEDDVTEEYLPDQDLTITGEDPVIPDEGVDAVPPEELELDAEPALDPESDPNFDPDADPSLEGDLELDADPDLDADAQPEGYAEASIGESTDFSADQILRDETAEARYRSGEEQIPPEVPTLGEAIADVDFGDNLDGDEMDGSDDPLNRGGSPLVDFDNPNPGE